MLVVRGHLVAIQKVSELRLTASSHQVRIGTGLIGKKHDTAGTDIDVVAAIIVLVIGGEVVCNGKAVGSRELNNTVAVFRAAEERIKITVPCGTIKIHVVVHGEAAAAHPDAAFARVRAEFSGRAVGCGIKNVIGKKLKIAGVKSHDPAVKGVSQSRVGVSGVGHIKNTACESQRGALQFLNGLELKDSTRTARAITG